MTDYQEPTQPEIAVVIPTIPPRHEKLQRALKSVERQRLQPTEVIVEVDHDHTGAAATRQRGLDRVTAPLVAFLDDDDELLPHHLKVLAQHLHDSQATVVYPWFTVEGGTDPFPGRFGADFDPDLLRMSNYVPINVLSYTEALQAAGGFVAAPNERGWQNEDWDLWKRVLDLGGTFSHLPAKTWTWHHHSSNTSGNPERWQ